MNKMNKYDIDEQFLTEAWANMRQQLDKELPVHKPWYFKKIWYVTSLAASLLLFTGFYCYKHKNFQLTNQYTQNSANINSAENKESNYKAEVAEAIENDIVSSNTSNNNEAHLAHIDDDEVDVKSYKSYKGDLLIKSRPKLNSAPVQNEINTTQNHLTKNQFSKGNTKTTVKIAKATLTGQNHVVKPTSSLSSASDDSPVPAILSNKNIPTENSELPAFNKVAGLVNIQNNEMASTSGAIDFLPLKTTQLSNNFNYKIATLLTDTPNSKIWRPKKPVSFGLAISLNSNVKDASGFRAGMFANYKFTDKFMIGARLAYAYTAVNTNYDVRYNMPASDDASLGNPVDEFKSTFDKINFNNNYQGMNTKLLLSYFPVKRLGIAAGLFGTRYIFNNNQFDFLEGNAVYNTRNLSSNYGFNKYKAGPAFELQYWVKPKLNVAATFEMNLIPEVKPEFWAAAKQDYLSNHFGIALQYQFN